MIDKKYDKKFFLLLLALFIVLTLSDVFKKTSLPEAQRLILNKAELFIVFFGGIFLIWHSFPHKTYMYILGTYIGFWAVFMLLNLVSKGFNLAGNETLANQSHDWAIQFASSIDLFKVTPFLILWVVHKIYWLLKQAQHNTSK